MNNNTITAGVIIAALMLVGIFGYMSSNEDTEKQATDSNASTVETVSEENCMSRDCLQEEELNYSSNNLPDTVVDALSAAIDDEYKARATYAAVIERFGAVRPFSMIISAEERHIASLKAIYASYGIDVPNDPYADIQVAATRAENCTIGVQAEIENAELYRNELLPAVVEYPNITDVFTRLMDDSQEKHLPAFERCTG